MAILKHQRTDVLHRSSHIIPNALTVLSLRVVALLLLLLLLLTVTGI